MWREGEIGQREEAEREREREIGTERKREGGEQQRDVERNG